ncbi:MAG: hypothetical protein ACJARD_001691 [Alphaproteobacteria bacterium]|jgi:hypothetical protein
MMVLLIDYHKHSIFIFLAPQVWGYLISFLVPYKLVDCMSAQSNSLIKTLFENKNI